MLNLIRYKNLIFILLIEWLTYHALLFPILQSYGLTPLTPIWMQWLVILATLLIAAGGYVINDYFDLKIDRINRPDKVYITEKITKKQAMLLYQCLTGIGVIIGLVISFLLHNFTLGFIFIVAPGMLWFYSASYKREFLVGNIIVALLSALMFFLPLLTETSLLTAKYGSLLDQTPIMSSLYGWICGYAGFAFLWTLIREIIKDAQDIEGDKEMECRTLPIVWGETTTKIIVTALVVLTIGLLYLCVAKYIVVPDPTAISIRYLLFGIAIPAACLLVLLWSKSCQAYRNASGMCKFIMLVGMLYMLVFYYLMAKAYGLAMFGIFKIV